MYENLKDAVVTQKKIDVLLVDDQPSTLDGIRSMLENISDIEVIGSVSSGEDSINAARRNRPDVILMDMMMGGMNGIEATRWIKDTDSSIKVILLIMESDKKHMPTVIRAGANGYLLKNAGKEMLIKAVRTVYEGGSFF